MDSWLKIILPVLLTAAIVAIAGIWKKVAELEKNVIHREVLEYRLEQIEDDLLPREVIDLKFNQIMTACEVQCD